MKFTTLDFTAATVIWFGFLILTLAGIGLVT